jgi:DNA-binding response OmpR family regulator
MNIKKKILVADDDPDILEQLSATLSAAGYEIVPAESCAAAEEALLRIRPDLAIFDLMMEDKDSGFVLSYQTRKLYPATPIIMLTGVAGVTGLSFSTQHAEAQSWTKIDRLLDKPVRPEQLRAEVRRLLGEENPAIKP